MPLELTRRAFAASALALATPLPALARASETERLNAFFEEVYQRNLKRSPIAQSRRGLKIDNDKWDDIGEARQQEGLRLTKGDLARLKTFDFAKLDPQAQLSYRLFERNATTAIEGFRWRRHDYLITQMGGLHRRVATVLLSNHQVDEVKDAEAYVKRLHGVKPLMAALVGELEKQEAAGVKPPKFVYDLTVYEAQNLITGAPFEAGADSPVWADFKAKVGKLSIPDADKAALIARGEAGMKEGFGPGYRQLIAHLKAAQATAGEEDGIWHVPEGEAYYRFQLEQYTTLPLTAEAIHETGLKEVARIHEEMRGIMRQVGFTGSLQDFFAFVRTDQQFYYPDSEAGRAQYLADNEAILKRALAKQGLVFGVQPKSDVVVRSVEKWREKSAAKAFYQNPPQDGSRPGVFYINLYDMKAAPKYQAAAILFHEATPGHHVETAVAHELTGIPSFRKFGGEAAFSEGWGLYAEGLAHEMGLYQGPYEQFGRLTMSLMRAVRLVVDTGLHAKRWTRQQALDYANANMPSSDYDNRREIERYIVLPGQATAYYIGKMKILELRQRAQAALGARFDIKAFHDAALKSGPLPLPMLEESIDAWIASQRVA